MTFAKLTYAFLTTAALGYSSVVQAAWPHDGEKVKAFGGEQTLITILPGIHVTHKDNILDTPDLDPQKRCVIQSVMKEKGVNETLIATDITPDRWATGIYSEDSGPKLGIHFERESLNIYNSSSSPMTVSLYNSDLSLRNVINADKNPESAKQNQRIVDRIIRCLAAS